MLLSAKAIVYGDDINTDLIIAGKYTKTLDIGALSSHCMEDLDPDFHKKCEGGAIVVAGKYFGCGSSREHAPIAIRESGVACVIAKSFARIFYRNAINIGLPIFECEAASDGIAAGDEVRVDFDTGLITNLTKNETYQAQPLPPFIQNIVNRGGLLNSLK